MINGAEALEVGGLGDLAQPKNAITNHNGLEVVAGPPRILVVGRHDDVQYNRAGGACVLDVIVPPYDEDAGRACHYFEAVAIRGGVFALREIPEPADFECLGAVYNGLRP